MSAHVTCDTPAHRRQYTHTPGLMSHISTCTDCHRLHTNSVRVQSAIASTSNDQSLTTTTIIKSTNTHRTTNGQPTKSTSVNCAAAQLLIKSDHKLHNHLCIAVFSQCKRLSTLHFTYVTALGYHGYKSYQCQHFANTNTLSKTIKP